MSVMDYIEIGLVLLAMVLLGFLIGRFSVKKQSTNGTIIIEPTEDGERERVRFVLDIDLDKIKTKRCLIFVVENKLSQ